MVGLLGRMAGGALAGFGNGLSAQAEQDGMMKRQERLAELQHGLRMEEQSAQNEFTTQRDATQNQFQTERDTRQNEFQTQRDDRQHGYRMGEIGAQGANSRENTILSDRLARERDEESAVRTAGREAEKFERDKEMENLRDQNLTRRGLTFREKDAELEGRDDTKELTPSDKRALDTVIKSNTDPTTKRTNWPAVVERLNANDRGDLVQWVMGSGGTVADALKKEAGRRATKEASDKAGWTSTDSTDFASDGGDRQRFIDRRTNEILGDMTGGGKAKGQGGAARAEKPAASSAPAKTSMSGAGTRDDPYAATSQADIDWFLANAPAGAVIVANGKSYTKK